MPARPRGNVPTIGLRWTIERASVEFGAPANTIRKSLGSVHIACGADRCYTTQQICEALYGDMHKERLRTQEQITKRYTLENTITQAEVLTRSEVAKGLATVADAMSCRILASELSRSAKEDLLRDLASIPLILRQVADGQTRLRRNGSHNGEEVATAD
jgi:hypothetical protein